MELILGIIVSVAVTAVVVGTALPISRSHRWWIRAMDFPRVQIAIFAAALLVPAWFVNGWWGWALLAAIVVCLVYQGIRIIPFTPLYPKELRLAANVPAGAIVTILSANVEMPNERYGDVAAMIDEVDPDILFLMETDQAWSDALAPQLARYPTVVRELRDDYWGMIFATRLKVRRAEAVYLTQDDTATLFAELECPVGGIFRFIGLHPQPPVPGVDTEDRDAEILYASRFARATDIPLVAVGDFNDAAWSDSTRRFKRIGGFLDPRVGRGMIASFDTRSRLLRVPIDQFFVTEEVAVHSFGRGPDVGSDHFPLIARIVTDRDLAASLNTRPKRIMQDDQDGIEEAMERYRLKLGHDPLVRGPDREGRA